VQADTIVPGAGNPAAYNRYAYAFFNPLRYTDPTGHNPGWCQPNDPTCSGPQMEIDDMISLFGVSLSGEWTLMNKIAIFNGLYAVGKAFAQVIGGSVYDAFRRVYRTADSFMSIERCPGGNCNGYTRGAVTINHHLIRFATVSENMKYLTNNLVHELGHAFLDLWGGKSDNNPRTRPGFNIPTRLLNNQGFYPSDEGFWQMHACEGSCDTAEEYEEVWADMFLGWTYQSFNDDRDLVGDRRREYMNENMPSWIEFSLTVNVPDIGENQ
jgi:hypothetical protein